MYLLETVRQHSSHFSVCVDILHIADRLTTYGTLGEPLGTVIARHVVTARTEDSRYFRTHADLAEPLVLDVEQELTEFLGLGVVQPRLRRRAVGDHNGFCRGGRGASVTRGGGGRVSVGRVGGGGVGDERGLGVRSMEMRLGKEILGEVATADGQTPVEFITVDCINLRRGVITLTAEKEGGREGRGKKMEGEGRREGGGKKMERRREGRRWREGGREGRGKKMEGEGRREGGGKKMERRREGGMREEDGGREGGGKKREGGRSLSKNRDSYIVTVAYGLSAPVPSPCPPPAPLSPDPCTWCNTCHT